MRIHPNHETLKILKNNKAPGENGIVFQFFKVGFEVEIFPHISMSFESLLQHPTSIYYREQKITFAFKSIFTSNSICLSSEHGMDAASILN